MKHLLIWGAGGQGAVTLGYALAMRRYDRIDFLDMKEKGHRSIPEYTVYEEERVNLSGSLRSYNKAIIVIGGNDLWEARASRLMLLGISLATVIHPTAVINPPSHISRGYAVLARAVVNPSAHVGARRTVNTDAVIEHDCTIGGFVDTHPGASMTGYIKIDRRSFLGVGSMIMDDITVGERPMVGAEAVATRNALDRVIMAGVPAKEIYSWIKVGDP